MSRAGDVTDLAGKSELDQARADMLVDCMDDATSPFFIKGYVVCQDAAEKVWFSQLQLTVFCRPVHTIACWFWTVQRCLASLA